MTSKLMTLVEQKFIFRNTSDELYHLLNDILSYIKNNTLDEEYARISGRCKLVLVELFTNALKHSDADQTVLELQISGDFIRINKTDTGRPFAIQESKYGKAIILPVEYYMLDRKVIIYSDDMASLYCVAESPEKLSFLVQDHDVEIPPIPSNLLEHFGLMIIAKAADRFTFKFDPALGTNNFTALLRY